MIEAMACGTPVIAFRCGSVPEVVDPGLTGFVVRSMDEAVAAGKQVARIDRRRCRETFQKRFSAARMADDYVAAYRRLLGRNHELAAGRDWEESTSRTDRGLLEECGFDVNSAGS
jgi:glycosyltransferase involved in cell wall biosynthesis